MLQQVSFSLLNSLSPELFQFVSKLSYPILKNENLVDEQNNVLDSTASQVWHLSVPFYSKILQNCYDCLYALFYFLLNPLAIIHSNLAALRALIASLYPCTLVSNFLVITYSGYGLDLDLLLLIRCGGDNEVPMCSQVFRIPCAFLPFSWNPTTILKQTRTVLWEVQRPCKNCDESSFQVRLF